MHYTAVPDEDLMPSMIAEPTQKVRSIIFMGESEQEIVVAYTSRYYSKYFREETVHNMNSGFIFYAAGCYQKLVKLSSTKFGLLSKQLGILVYNVANGMMLQDNETITWRKIDHPLPEVHPLGDEKHFLAVSKTHGFTIYDLDFNVIAENAQGKAREYNNIVFTSEYQFLTSTKHWIRGWRFVPGMKSIINVLSIRTTGVKNITHDVSHRYSCIDNYLVNLTTQQCRYLNVQYYMMDEQVAVSVIGDRIHIKNFGTKEGRVVKGTIPPYEESMFAKGCGRLLLLSETGIFVYDLFRVYDNRKKCKPVTRGTHFSDVILVTLHY